MNKRQKSGVFLLIAGLVLVLSGLSIHLMQKQADTAAGKTSAFLLEQLDTKTLTMPTESQPAETIDPQLPIKTCMDYDLIGVLQVPSVNLRLPILADWSDELLKVAPCRYQGSLTGGEMIIMGHNYTSHFYPLLSAQLGDTVVLETTEGKTLTFRVDKIEHLHRTEGEKLPSAYPLTIVTCKLGGLERVVLRCSAVDQ